jgi:hypothetical protein
MVVYLQRTVIFCDLPANGCPTLGSRLNESDVLRVDERFGAGPLGCQRGRAGHRAEQRPPRRRLAQGAT